MNKDQFIDLEEVVNKVEYNDVTFVSFTRVLGKSDTIQTKKPFLMEQ